MAEKASCSQPTELDAVAEKGVENSAASTSDTDPKSAIDQFLEMQRRERNSEIKNLREDSKVVTVGKRRQRINHFLLRVIHGEDVPSDSESTKSDETNQSSSADEQQQTPARVEIRGLFDQRPVSSVLQSNQFRRQLENIIRGNVIRQERELETNLRLRNAGLSVAAGGAPLTESSVSSHSVEDVRSESSSISHTSGHDFPPPPLSMLNSSQEPQMGHSVPPPPPVPQQFLPSRTNQHPVTHPQPSSVYSQQQLGTYQQPPWIYQHSPVAHQQQPVMYQQQPGVYQQPPWVYQQPAGANYQQTPWFFQQQPQVYQGHSPVYQRPIIHQPQQFGRHQYPQAHQQSPLPLPAVVNQQSSVANQPQPYLTQQPGADDIFVEHHREQIIADITELVHNQLVTQTLESNFRGTLEVMMQNRLSQSGTDGERVMNVVQNLPRSDSYRRNDFSHLGIFAAPVEGTEAATAMPLGAVGPWGQEMSALKAQMQELQNMVRLSFDLQLDLQRAIRQEVAAALSGQTGQVSNSSCANEGHTNHPANEGNCLICLDKGVDSVLYQCGHMCVCLSCGLRLKSMNAHCPICRAPIRDVIRAYRSQRD